MERKHLLILITNPFGALNVFHSGLAGELEKRYRLSVMSDRLSAAEVAHLNRHLHLNLALVEDCIRDVPQWVKWLRTLQMLLFGHAYDLATVRIKLLEVSRAASWLFANTPMVKAISHWLAMQIRSLLIRATHRGDASLPACDAILSTSPLDMRENALCNAMRRVPCIALVISWDNLTSKGVMNVNAKLVLVWGDVMLREYERLYPGIATVHVCGVPRFHIYFKQMTCEKRRGDAKVLLFCTGSKKHYACQKYIVEDLLAYPDAVILIRCHPGDDPSRYWQYEGHERVRLLDQGRAHSQLPPMDYLDVLHVHLAFCDVCVQAASTMLLDAAACNKPVISIAYDATSNVPYARSVRRFYDYSHHVAIRSILEPTMVHDREQLFTKLDSMLNGETLLADVSPVIGHYDPDLCRLYIDECIGQ